MKILHVIPAIAPRYGGPSRAIVEMCKGVRDLDVETLIATTDADGRGRLPVKSGQLTEYEGLDTIFFRRQWSEAFKYSSPLASWLGAHVTDFDVVHVHAVFSHSSLAAAKACRRHDVPYIVRPLGSLDPWSLGQKRFQKRMLWHAGVKQLLQGASAIHYTAREEQRLAERLPGLAPGAVIPLGIDVALLSVAVQDGTDHDTPDSDRSPYVLVLGRLHAKKGIPGLIEAFLDVVQCDGFDSWRLVIAGDGDCGYAKSLDRLIQKRDGKRRISFPGWLDGQARVAMLRNAALLAMPSHQENFGLSAVEAMACGVPVFVSRQVNISDEVEAAQAGWVTSLENIEFRQRLGEALADENERTRRGAAGRQLVSGKYTWPVAARQLLELYESIMHGTEQCREPIFVVRSANHTI